jgi:predicted Fe-S protein YdhL (DUF1289 family)
MSIEAMKLALEALESGCRMEAGRLAWIEYDSSLVKQVITSLRQAIAEAEKQEQDEPESGFFSREAMKAHSDFHPQQRTWVELTEEEKIKLWNRAEKRGAYQGVPSFIALIQEVEAKLKDKNYG